MLEGVVHKYPNRDTNNAVMFITIYIDHCNNCLPRVVGEIRVLFIPLGMNAVSKLKGPTHVAGMECHVLFLGDIYLNITEDGS